MDQTHINYQSDDWQYPMRNTLPPISMVNPHVPSRPGPHNIVPAQPAYVRITAENTMGSWPDHNKYNCLAGYDCTDPVFPAMDPYGVQTRWAKVSSAGPRDVAFKVISHDDWLFATPSEGLVKADGTEDIKIIFTVDWDRVPSPAPGNGTVLIAPDDGTNVTITVPIFVPARPTELDAFKGFVQGDGYVAIEAAHFSSNTSVDGYAFEEIETYGHTHSGLEVFPMTSKNFTAGSGPKLEYDFWAHSGGEATAYVHLGTTLNFLSGKHIAFGIAFDDGDAKTVLPVPDAETDPEDLMRVTRGTGAVPPDWNGVVADEIRSVKFKMGLGRQGGPHRITLYGMTTGVIFERVVVDFGGVEERGYSYLGPPESLRQ